MENKYILQISPQGLKKDKTCWTVMSSSDVVKALMAFTWNNFSFGIIFLLELFFVAETQRKNTYFTFVMKETNKTLQLTRAVQSEQVLALDRVAKAEIKVQAFILGGKDGWLQIHFTSWTNILSNFDKYNLHF